MHDGWQLNGAIGIPKVSYSLDECKFMWISFPIIGD
jgi:hypothetical protein